MATAWVKQLRTGRPWKAGKPLAEQNVINRCCQLRGVFARTLNDGIIGRNPAAHLKNQPTIDARVEERMVPTIEQIRALTSAAGSGGSWTETVSGTTVTHRVPAAPWLTLCIHIAMETGLHAGEVSGPRVRDLALDQ
ncbi:hypothetical protein [Corynebacterium terpenotabidum]|uniref:hypothetical protein n=1 Tax=Corynebacterium terpenotabidum TaxID=89154 RepID=UPI0004031DEE|nr:hypothetical protein [Corynebacterium terpenotabidum]